MNAPQTLRAEITITGEEQEKLRRYASIGILMKQCFPTIDSYELATLAAMELSQIRQMHGEIEERRKRRLAPAKMIIEQANEDYQPALKANKAADEYLSGLLSNWYAEQKRKEEEARRKAEEEAKAERARQEKEAAQAREKAEQALEQAREAARTGEAGEIAEINLERATVIADAAAQAQAVLAIAPMPMPFSETMANVSGLTFANHWEAELTVSEDRAKEMIMRAIFGGDCHGLLVRSDLLAGLKLDMIYFNRLAVAQQSAFNVPGMRAVNKPVARRSRK